MSETINRELRLINPNKLFKKLLLPLYAIYNGNIVASELQLIVAQGVWDSEAECPGSSS